MATEKKPRAPRKPRSKQESETPTMVRHLSLDEATRTRLTEVGWIEDGEPMVNVETIRLDDQQLEVLTFDSGKRLITVNPLVP